AIKSIAPALPMVCPLLSDAALSTLVTSYARPAGSVTGLTNFVEGVVTKLLELALDIVPYAVRIGLLTNPTGASMTLFVQQFEAAAGSRAITLIGAQARVAEDLAPAFDSFAKGQVQATPLPLGVGSCPLQSAWQQSSRRFDRDARPSTVQFTNIGGLD